jgi:hypothetical protein
MNDLSIWTEESTLAGDEPVYLSTCGSVNTQNHLAQLAAFVQGVAVAAHLLMNDPMDAESRTLVEPGNVAGHLPAMISAGHHVADIQQRVPAQERLGTAEQHHLGHLRKGCLVH